MADFLFEFGEGVAEFGSVLFDDGGVGDDVDDAVQVVFPGVAEGEGKGRKGFAAAGGDG